MNKQNLLKMIAESGYNIGYGAKKHLATFDLIEKMPGWLGFVAFVVGIFALFVPPLASNIVSALMLIFGISALYINGYNSDKQSYEKGGAHLTHCFHKLRTLYYEITSLPDTTDFSSHVALHEKIYEEAFSHTVSKQIFLSDWYAHYKFFWQQQIEWIDEQKKFGFWRDKVPLTLYIVLGLITIIILGCFLLKWNPICSIFFSAT